MKASTKRTARRTWRAARWVSRRLWRYRSGLAPWAVAAGILVAGLLLHAVAPWAAAVVALVALGVAPVLLHAGHRLSPWLQRALAWFVPERIDAGRKGVLDRDSERTYLAALVAVGGGWMAFIAWAGMSQPAWIAWAATVASLGLPWWWHRRFRSRRRSSRWARRWPHVASSIKAFEGSRVIPSLTTGDRLVTDLVIELRRAQTVKSVGGTAREVESALSTHLRPGAVTISQAASSRRVLVRIVPRNPWQGVIPHPGVPKTGPIPFGQIDLRSELCNVARLEDRAPLGHKMTRHTMICAQSGGGKSVMGDTLMAWMTIGRAGVVGVDMAGGVSLGEWEPTMLAPVATTAGQASELLNRVMAAVEHRERDMRKRKLKKWDGTPIFLVIDELPSLVRALGPEIVGPLTVLAERARKAEVWIYVMLQNGTKEDAGSTEFRAQMMAVFGGRLDQHMNGILWGSAVKQGWDGTQLQAGTWLLRDDEHNIPRVAKGVYLTDGERERLIRAAVDAGAIMLDHGSAGILSGSTSQVVDHRPVPALEVAPSLAVAAADFEDEVLAQLPAEGGIGPTAIAKALDVDRGRVDRALRKLAEAGRARNSGRGKWVRT